MSNIKRMNAVTPFEKAFEYKRLMSNKFSPYVEKSYYGDLAVKRAPEKKRRDFYNYLLYQPEDKRGTMYTDIYMINFEDVPDGART